MEVYEPSSKQLRGLKLFAIGWIVLWIILAFAYYLWFNSYSSTTFKGWWLFLAILFQPPVLIAVIAIPEVMIAAIVARLRIKESQ